MLNVHCFHPRICSELDYDLVVGDQVVTPSYDTLCGEGHVSGGCEPVSVISAEKLTDYIDGPAETKRIAEALMNNPKISQYVIESEAWDCIWNELIVQRKGVRTILDRPGTSEEDYNFSAEMLEVMIYELDRLIAKYSSDEWNTKTTANRLVELITDHRSLIQIELDEVNSGHRKLTERDILGPKERQRRRQLKLQEEAKKRGNEPEKKVMSNEILKKDKDHALFFHDLEKSLTEKRREQMKIDAIARSNAL